MTVGPVNLLAVLLVQLLGTIGVVADAKGDTDGTGGDIVLASVRSHESTVTYRVHVYGLHDTNEITGAFPSGAYFNRDGIFRAGREMRCAEYSYRHVYRQGNSIAEVRIPRTCLPDAGRDTVELALLKLDQHETVHPVYRVSDTVTLPALVGRTTPRNG